MRFRSLFVEHIRALELSQIDIILSKEVTDLNSGQAPIIKVMEVISQREQLLKQIR